MITSVVFIIADGDPFIQLGTPLRYRLFYTVALI